ncbi:class I SAM-dependent methyltransferase [Paraburkholderia azotifigens]|uniref:Class I SAM-dependent methyltransferase n=1 Tax=Paraburkholderia azotifigens TaxID=2057004 RepID=A0A5C6VM52_9BURK|nr:class I SAM-dependent methyltransferase [Paraburkholderia azotifigens]TXC86090.1 class I SAM-dependent methyltransferase [Paraburkholderia azotifigens]TXC89066.1 class I SAM-dependent methyltransferase [Paraburkholderia azotifigens]
MTDSHYSDPRLVALYDALNPFAADTRFYLDLAARTEASRVVDIGCGTGLLACELAQRGHIVTGVDPSRAMLDVARGRPGGGRVKWIEGDAARLGAMNADLAVMTGHVAQVFLDDTSFDITLAAAHAALRPGGRLAFESRNPLVSPWTAWTPEKSRRMIDDTRHGAVEIWQQPVDVKPGRVRFETCYRFAGDGDTVVSVSELRFRTRTELDDALRNAGFSEMEWFGDWFRSPVHEASRELIVVATRG